MKVRDTLNMDLLHATLQDKLINFVGAKHCLGSWDRWQSMQLVTKTFPSWQYNGVAPMNDILFWCEEHLGNNWTWHWETIYFKYERDRTAFMLRWA